MPSLGPRSSKQLESTRYKPSMGGRQTSDSQLPRYMTTGKLKPRFWEMGSIPSLLTTQVCPWTVDMHVPGTRKAH